MATLVLTTGIKELEDGRKVCFNCGSEWKKFIKRENEPELIKYISECIVCGRIIKEVYQKEGDKDDGVSKVFERSYHSEENKKDNDRV